jgi:serine/threonine protein kinase
LFNYINEKGALEQPFVAQIAQQLTDADTQMRIRGFWHHTIKLNNTLLNSIDEINPSIVLCDLGFCDTFGDDETCDTIMGTVAYTAPEMAFGLRYNTRVDIWSIGVTLPDALEHPFFKEFGPTGPQQCQAMERFQPPGDSVLGIFDAVFN